MAADFHANTLMTANFTTGNTVETKNKNKNK